MQVDLFKDIVFVTGPYVDSLSTELMPGIKQMHATSHWGHGYYVYPCKTIN